MPKDKHRRSLTKKVKKKYQTQRQKRESIKRANKKAIEELKKKNHVNYDDDANIDDLSTIGHNSDTENMLTTMVVTVAQQQAKKIKRYKNL